MRKTTKKTILFVCIASIMMVGASLFLAVKLEEKYSEDLAVYNTIGEKLSEKTESFVYTAFVKRSEEKPVKDQGDAITSIKYNNIEFVSYSEHWDDAKLKQLALELFENTHGEEIAYVARVELHGKNHDEYAGLYRNSYEKFSLPISINHLLPDDMTLDFSSPSSVIILTGADEHTTVESMARTLSHEYGHHFTQYHFGFNGSAIDLLTKYASLRIEQGTPIYAVVTDWEHYLENHMWDIQEIAAEDYVFLMGSPLAKRQIDYLDNSELAQLYAKNPKQYDDYLNLSIYAANSYPHENPVLSSPCHVEDLAEYYYSFVDAQAPEYTQISDNFGTMGMNWARTSDGSYTITWDPPWPYDNIKYTLVAYDANDYMLKPIKTVNGDETASADFGLQKSTKNQNEYTIDDNLDKMGFVRFRVVVLFSDGTVVFSDPFDVHF